ncbi:hypothetical protein OF001_U160099 [Pseudomonas sp. OF001]|nr:hypothetical protein OF001_U160099 [Pseudomonas sp. OF001]
MPGRHGEEGRQARQSVQGREDRPREAAQGPHRHHRVCALLGDPRRGPGAGHRHHDRLEARGAHRRREDRQAGHDLRPGHVRPGHRRVRHRHGQRLQPAGVDHPHPLLRGGRHHGRQPQWPAGRHHPHHPDGLGADPAGVDGAERRLLLGGQQAVRLSDNAAVISRGGFGPLSLYGRPTRLNHL